MSTVFAGQTQAYANNPPNSPWPSFPALAVSWDGATATVTQAGNGAAARTVGGQALQQAGTPLALMQAVSGGNPWEALSV